MARPTDWSKLGLDQDPTPGDQPTMAAVCKALDSVKDSADQMEATINAIVKNVDGGWTGKSADALRGQISDQLQKFFRGMQQCMDEAAPALHTYLNALAQHQSDADTALAKAQGLPDKDPGLTQYTNAAKQAGTDLTAAANTAASAIADAQGKLASALTSSEIFWEAFQWLALALGILGLIFGGPLAIVAWMANIALFIKTIVDFAKGDTNFLGLFLSFLGIVAPMTRGIGGDIANMLKNGMIKIIGAADKFGGGVINVFDHFSTLLVDFTTIGLLGSIKVLGALALKGGMWVFDKVLTFPNVIGKVGMLAFGKFSMVDEFLVTGFKYLGTGIGEGIDFVLTEIGTGRFVRLFLPVTKDEFTALDFTGALWRSFERTLPGIVTVDKMLDDKFTLFQLTKGLNLSGDMLAKIVIDVKAMHDFKPAAGTAWVQMPNGTLLVPDKFLTAIKINDIDAINSLVKNGLPDTHLDLGDLGDLGNLGKLPTSGFGAGPIRGIEMLDGAFKPIELSNLTHAESVAVVKIGDDISLSAVAKELGVTKVPALTGMEHLAGADLNTVLPKVDLAASALGNAAVAPLHDVLSLVKNVDAKGANLVEQSMADIKTLTGDVDHSLAGATGALHGVGLENVAVRAEPIAVAAPNGVISVTDHLALGKQAFDQQVAVYAGKVGPETLNKMGADFLTQIKDVHTGWRDPRVVDPRLSDLQVNRLIDNLPKQFSRQFERTGWIDGIGREIRDDPGYGHLSIDGRVKFDLEIDARLGAGFDRAWSGKNAAFAPGLDLSALKQTLRADLQNALGKAMERDDWMHRVGVAFEHGLGENAEIAGKLPPAELAQIRQDILGSADQLFHNAKANDLKFTPEIQAGLAHALTHGLDDKLADQLVKVSKINTNGLKGRGIASDWATANPRGAALLGDAGFQKLFQDLAQDLRKIPPGSRPQIYNQVLKNFEGKIGLEADLRTVLADAAHAFHGAPADAAKFRENIVLDYLSNHSLPNGMPHGMTPDVAKNWLGWEKDNGDIFGNTLSHLHPIDKDAAWSQARIDLAKDFQPKIQLEKQLAPKIDIAIAKLDDKIDDWSEDHGPVAPADLKALHDEFDKALRDAGPAVLNDQAAFDKLTGNLLDGADHRLASGPEVAALKGQANLKFQDGIKDWAAKTGKTPAFFGFSKITEDFDAHLATLFGGARRGLGDGGGLDLAAFGKGLDDYLAGLGAKLDKEAGLGKIEADAFEKAYGDWLGHDVPIDTGFSADRLTDLATEFRTMSRDLTDHLGPAEAKPIIDALADHLPARFDLELRISSRLDAAGDGFDRGLRDWHGPAGLRDLNDGDLGRVREEFDADAKEASKIPDTFWTGAGGDAKAIRSVLAGIDGRLGALVSAVPGRLDFEARLLDELSHAPELLGDGAKFDHLAQQFRADFTHGFHDVWGNGRDADSWLAKEQQGADVFTNGPGARIPKTSLEVQPYDARPLDSRPVVPQPHPESSTVAGTWGRPVDMGGWNAAWHGEVDEMFTGKGIFSIGTVKDGKAVGGNGLITKLYNKLDQDGKAQLKADLDALRTVLGDPGRFSADARPLLGNLFDHHIKINPKTGQPAGSSFPSSALNDALESVNAKLIAEVHGGDGGLRPWPFNASGKKPDYLLPGLDGTVPQRGVNGIGDDAVTFYASVTNVGDHLKTEVKNFADVGTGVRGSVDSKLLAYGDKNVRVVVDLSKSPGLVKEVSGDFGQLVEHIEAAFNAPWTNAKRLIQSDLVIPGHFLGQSDPAVITFRFDAAGQAHMDPLPADWGKAMDGGSDHPGPGPDPHPGGAEPGIDGDVFSHPDLPGGGRILPGGLLLSNRPEDIALAAKLPDYDGVFKLVTHFDDAKGQAHVNDVSVPHNLVAGYFKSGLLPWREGQLIVVVGCGAEDLAAALRTDLHTPTVGETDTFVMTHDGINYTGKPDWSLDGPSQRMNQPDWRPTPDVLQAGADGGARFKLFLPGDKEIEPYLLGSDFNQAMRRLGFDPALSTSTLDYLDKLAAHGDGLAAVQGGLKAFADKVFAAHLPPAESLKTALSQDGHLAGIGVDWKSNGIPIDQDLRSYLRNLTGLEAKDPQAARDWRLTAFKQDPDIGSALKAHLFPGGTAPRRLYFGHSDAGSVANPLAGHDFVDVVTRIERGSTPTVDIVHVGAGYADHWTAALSDPRALDDLKDLKGRFGAAGASEIDIVRFDDAMGSGTAVGTLSTGVTDGVHIRLTLLADAASLKPFLKVSEPLVLTTGVKGAADALSAGKALLYQGLDHAGPDGGTHFLDQLADWGVALGGKNPPMKNMLYAFAKQDLFKDTSGPTRLGIVANLAKVDTHLAQWRGFSDLMAVGNDANVRALGLASRKIWEQGPHGPEIQDAVNTLTGLAAPTLKDLDVFEKWISGLVGTTGTWSADAGKDIDELIHGIEKLSLSDGDVDVVVHEPMDAEVTPAGAYVQDNKFFHPDLPGHGYVLNDSLLLSNRPADLRLSDGVPRYEGVFRLMTHFEKPSDELFVNGKLLPAGLAHDFLTSGVTDWRPGMPILVIGCGAEGVAEMLRTRLEVPTIGATHNINSLDDRPALTFTGDVPRGVDVVDDIISANHFWTDAPKDLSSDPVPEGKATFKLFLPGDAAGVSYPLGSDLFSAMKLLGLPRSDLHVELPDLDMADATVSSWARDVNFAIGDRDYHVTVQDDEHNPVLQNPFLVAPNIDDHLHLQVRATTGDAQSLGQFCGYLSVHWLTQTGHDLTLGFKDLDRPLQDDAVHTVTQWMTGDAHGVHGSIAMIDDYTVAALSGDRPAIQVGAADFRIRLAGLPDGTRIVFSTVGHAKAAVLLDGGGVRVYDPEDGGLTDYPRRQGLLDATFTQAATTFVFEDRAVVPPPALEPPAPPALQTPVLKQSTTEPPVLKSPTTEPPVVKQPTTDLVPPKPDPITTDPITTHPTTTDPTTTGTTVPAVEPVFDVDPLTHNPWSTPDPDRVIESVSTFVDAIHDIKPPSPADPWSQITVLDRAGHPNGDVYAIDHLNSRWVKLSATDPDGAAHLWDGTRGPYLGKGPVTIRPNGDIVLIGEDKKPFYLKENLGDGRFVEVFRAQDGKRHWFEWRGDGPSRDLLYSGKRVYGTNADGAVFKDFYENGSLARDYRVTLDKGLIRAERGLGNLRGVWVWNRYDKDGNFLAKGIREYEGSDGWHDTLSFGEPGARIEVVVAKQWSVFSRWSHSLHFQDHTIDLLDGKPGDPIKTRYTYKEISPQDKETGSSEFIGPNRILVLQRVAEQRVPTWFAKHFAELDIPNRGLFGGVDFPAGGVFGGDSRFQLYSWTEHEIVAEGPGAAPITAPVRRAGGMRVATPDGSTFDFMTVQHGAIGETGVLVRSVVKLDDGTKLEIGKNPDTGKWASVADLATGATGGGVLNRLDGRTLNWKQIDSDKKVISQGIRTFGPGHQWTDTLADAPHTVVRSTDDIGDVSYHLGQNTALTRDPIGLIIDRTDHFPTAHPNGVGEVVTGSGNPLSGKWKWQVTDVDGAVDEGLRFPFRSHPGLGSWDDSFVDFKLLPGATKPVLIREIRALDKGRGLAAYRLGADWHSDIRGLDGKVSAGSGAIRQWKQADGAWGRDPRPGTDPQVWRDVPVADRANFIDPPVLRATADGKVRIYGLKDGVPDKNVRKEFDHGGKFRTKDLVDVTVGGRSIYRETHIASGQWIETLLDGTRLRYRSLNGYIHIRDTFDRWSVRPDFGVGGGWRTGGWKTGGREYEYRGGGTEFRGYNRMWREPNRLEYRNIDGTEGKFVSQGLQQAQKAILDFLQDYAFDVMANILVTGASNNWNFSGGDWGKIFAGGAVSSGVKGASGLLQETVLKKIKDGIGNTDSGKFWGRFPYNHDKTWDNEWAGNENPRRWRSGLYDYSVNGLLTTAISGLVLNAFNASVFGVGADHVKVSGLEALQAGGLGMAGSLVGGLLAVGPRTALHQLGSGRFFHQGGIPDLLITFGEKAFEKWFIGDVLAPGLNLKFTPPPSS